ncbi:MAG: protein kinase [Gammaproteobacteria bacterium]|nr:protein kinase [Gammaproteobacteria bacterium]
MAVLSSLLFSRTLKQFLECQDLTSAKGIELTNKISGSAKDSLERLIETIPETKNPHRDVLKKICLEHAVGANQELLLSILENETTLVRATAADILSQSTRINVSKLFKHLHETDVSKSEIIDILSTQKQLLKPEQIINNALKLEAIYAERLLDLAKDCETPADFDGLLIEPEGIENPNIKIKLLRYLSQLKQPEAARIIGKFFTDKNKTIVLEALKSLRALSVPFDAAVILPFIETMSEHERQIGMEIICQQASPELVPKLAPWTTGKSDETREIFIKLLVDNATNESLEKFLLRLDQQEWWGKDQAVKCMLRLGEENLFKSAQGLVEHSQEFVRNTAQQLAAQMGGAADLDSLKESAMHESWQIRDNAIKLIGFCGQREALLVLKEVLKQWPTSAAGILKAVVQLGFSKGLEIAFACLKLPEAATQREALIAVSKLTTKQHAGNVRETVMRMVPKLQATVKDTAKEVVTQLTNDFKLPELKIDSKDFFETRLLEIVDTQDVSQVIGNSRPPVEEQKTEVVRFQNIEELKENDLWMDRYRIKREIGRGAMGRVMLAEDEMVGESLILKFMHPELTADGASRERFLREVKYSRKVSHANVIRIHDMLFKDSLCAISMEFFKSRGIDELLKEKKKFGAIEGLDILYQVAEGMSAAHKQQVIHRDLKPSNILIDDTGLVKVVDFGIASASSNTDSTLTKTGSIIGTPAYLSPERAKGLEAHERCDIYALGIIAYCMFTGQLPYKGEPMAILFQHLEGNASPIHEVDKSISPRLSLLVQKMMAVEADNRIQTMDEVCKVILDTKKKL